ncbi:MAG: T9SS type A sorting domain-containing protein [Burkholderiales bacterium]|nr:T9SS type A sorting domain-containing protein [Bacteroidia bacterium]
MKTKICSLFFYFICVHAFASHIVGGEISYRPLTNNNYEIKITVYRDCYFGIPPFDNPLVVSVFNSGGTLVQNVPFNFLGLDTVSMGAYLGACLVAPVSYCIEKTTYCDTLNLPLLTGGYTIVTQRCCRSSNLLNLLNPNQIGSTYWTHIPGPEVTTINSSPVFSNEPAFLFCNGNSNSYNDGATDADGDSLAYSFSTPFAGLDACCPLVSTTGTVPSGTCTNLPPSCPTACSQPPYQPVVYINPYQSNYPIASFPAIAIDPSTGIINLTPNLTGDFAVGVCVKEYRNGILLGTYYRDFQAKVYNCQVCTNIKESSQKPFSFYPNPGKQFITIKDVQPGKILFYKFFNVSGKLVLNGKIDHEYKIDVSSIDRGMYFIKITDNENTDYKPEKIIIE